MADPNNMGDHDLLIIIHTKLERVIQDVKDLSNNITDRITKLEATKLDQTTADQILKDADALHLDHETRIRRIERWGSVAVGGLAVIQFLAEFLLK